jgi:hypothetical protein
MANSYKMMSLAVFLALSVMVTAAFAGGKAGLNTGSPFVWSSMRGDGVWSPKEEFLGRVWDLVVDSRGQTAFLVISTPGVMGIHGKNVAVPFASLSYDREKRHYVIDVPRERLLGAPPFASRFLYSEKWAEDVYRYFGRAPYWTEGELVEKGVKPEENPLDFGGPYSPPDFR